MKLHNPIKISFPPKREEERCCDAGFPSGGAERATRDKATWGHKMRSKSRTPPLGDASKKRKLILQSITDSKKGKESEKLTPIAVIVD